MNDQVVSIERAKNTAPCRLWDNRLAAPGSPLKVTVEQAADLMSRAPEEWTVAAKAEADLVKAELKKRNAPAEAGGGN